MKAEIEDGELRKKKIKVREQRRKKRRINSDRRDPRKLQSSRDDRDDPKGIVSSSCHLYSSSHGVLSDVLLGFLRGSGS